MCVCVCVCVCVVLYLSFTFGSASGCWHTFVPYYLGLYACLSICPGGDSSLGLLPCPRLLLSVTFVCVPERWREDVNSNTYHKRKLL